MNVTVSDFNTQSDFRICTFSQYHSTSYIWLIKLYCIFHEIHDRRRNVIFSRKEDCTDLSNQYILMYIVIIEIKIFSQNFNSENYITCNWN